MATDRELLKQAQSGHIGSVGATDPIDAVAKAHEEIFLLAQDTDASLAERGFRVHKKCRVKESYFTPDTALAINGTNYVTIDVQKRDGAGGAAVSVATMNTNTGGSALAAFVPELLNLSATDANLEVAVGNVLTAKTTETGTPVSPLGVFTIVVEYK